jgi:transcriptional regulator with XRE-family HTH domain
MDQKTLMKEIGNKLKEIREPSGYNHREMGERLGIDKTSYYRYENGETPPKLMTLYKLGSEFDISLDWLIRGIDPMHCKEREVKKEAEPPLPPPPPPPPAPVEILPDDVKELVEHMDRIPVLRYKILLYFLHLKEKYKETVDAVMKEKKEKKKESA